MTLFKTRIDCHSALTTLAVLTLPVGRGSRGDGSILAGVACQHLGGLNRAGSTGIGAANCDGLCGQAQGEQKLTSVLEHAAVLLCIGMLLVIAELQKPTLETGTHDST